MRATSIPNLGRESVSATGEFLTEKMLPGKGQNIGEKGLRLSTGATHGASSPRWADFEWSASADDTSGCGISTKRKALWTAVAVRLLAALAVGQAQEQYLDVYIGTLPTIQHTLREEGYAKFLKTNAEVVAGHRDSNRLP